MNVGSKKTLYKWRLYSEAWHHLKDLVAIKGEDKAQQDEGSSFGIGNGKKTLNLCFKCYFYEYFNFSACPLDVSAFSFQLEML